MTDWEMKVRNFMCLNKSVKKGEIVFTGSSLCELFPINEMLQNVEPRIRVYNRGIGGDVTDGLLERLMSQYRKILMQIQARLPETKIYVMSYYPVNRELPGADPEAVKAQFGARTNAELKEVNAEVEKMAEELGCTYINVFDCLLDEKSNLKAEYTIEGMHMYANGYAAVLEKLMPYLLEE